MTKPSVAERTVVAERVMVAKRTAINRRVLCGTNRTRIYWRVLCSVTLMLLFTLHAEGVGAQGPAPTILREVAFEQKLDAQTPLDAVFRDESGNLVRFGDLLHGKPVVLTLNYLQCKNLCPLILDSLIGSLSDLSFSIGHEFDVITVSIDPRELPSLATAKKNLYVKRYGRAGAEMGWPFLTAEPSAIQQLTQAVGFHYVYDARQDEFAHPAGVIVLTPEGKVSRYLYGAEIAAQDLRLALVEASQNKIGTAVDQLLLICYHYDPEQGKYSTLALDVTRWAGALTVLVLVGFLVWMWHWDLRRYK